MAALNRLGRWLFDDPVDAIASVVPLRLNLYAVLLGRGEDEPAHAVSLPSGSRHDFGQGRAFRPPDHLQDFLPFALTLLEEQRTAGVGAGLARTFRTRISGCA